MRDVATQTILAVTHWTGARHVLSVTAAVAALALAIAIRVSMGAWTEQGVQERAQLTREIGQVNLQFNQQTGRLESLLSPKNLAYWSDVHDMVEVGQRNVWRLP